MNERDQKQLETELRRIYQEKNPNGARRWTQEQVEDCTALIIISSVEGKIENLDETSRVLVTRFLKRANLDAVSGEQFQINAKKYFADHPVAEDLVNRLARFFRDKEMDVALVVFRAREAFKQFLGSGDASTAAANPIWQA